VPESDAGGPGDAGGRTPRPDPFQTCGGWERAFRAPGPGLCRDCRDDGPLVSEGGASTEAPAAV